MTNAEYLVLLKDARGRGVRQVVADGVTVEWKSDTELAAAIAYFEGLIATAAEPGTVRVRRVAIGVDKGLIA